MMTKAVRATSNDVSTNKRKCVARGDATNWPQHARKKEASNEHVVMQTAWCDPFNRGHNTGNNKRASTLRQTRTCTAMQNTLPTAVRGNLRSACNWVQRGGQRWSHKTAATTTHLRGRHSWIRPKQVPDRNFLRSTSATAVAHVLVCSTISWRDFESADTSRLRLRNLKWSRCSWCQVWSVALSLAAAGTTSTEQWR